MERGNLQSSVSRNLAREFQTQAALGFCMRIYLVCCQIFRTNNTQPGVGILSLKSSVVRGVLSSPVNKRIP